MKENWEIPVLLRNFYRNLVSNQASLYSMPITPYDYVKFVNAYSRKEANKTSIVFCDNCENGCENEIWESPVVNWGGVELSSRSTGSSHAPSSAFKFGWFSLDLSTDIFGFDRKDRKIIIFDKNLSEICRPFDSIFGENARLQYSAHRRAKKLESYIKGREVWFSKKTVAVHLSSFF